MKALFYLAIFLIGYLTICAEPSANFYVVNVKGNGYYLRDKYQIPLKVGSALVLNDRIILGKQSAITLICNNYSLFTIVNSETVNAQIFPIRNYIDSCRTDNSGITGKFLKYVWKQFQEKDVAVNIPDQNNMKEFGAADRGCSDAAFSEIRDTIAIYQKPFKIKYYPLDTTAQIEFVVFEEQRLDTFYQSAVHNGCINISDSLIHMMDTGKIYNWAITRNGTQSCDYKTFKKISTGNYTAIITPPNKSSFNSLSKSDQNKILMFLLNEKNVVAEAIYHLKIAKGRNQDSWYRMIEDDLKNQFTK